MFMLNVKINKKNPHYMKEHIPTTTISFKTSLRLLCLSASVMLYKEASDSSSICLNSYHVLSLYKTFGISTTTINFLKIFLAS